MIIIIITLLHYFTTINHHFVIPFPVSKSRCASYIGVTGINIQETENMFKLITKDNKLKSIPKGHSVFTFQLRDHMFTLYGDQLRYRSAIRATKKFKNKPSIDL